MGLLSDSFQKHPNEENTIHVKKLCQLNYKYDRNLAGLLAGVILCFISPGSTGKKKNYAGRTFINIG